MSEDARDQHIEVFALDDDADEPRGPAATEARGHRPPAPIRPGAGEVRQPGASPGADEIRQGPSDARLRPTPPRVSLGRAGSFAPGQLAAAVAALVVVAFLAGLWTGHRTEPRRAPPTVAASTATDERGTGEFGSVLPTAPSFSIPELSRVPLPSGTAGPGGNVAPSAVYALQLASRPTDPKGQSLERRDPGALSGPWSVIVRRDDGSLGRHSSVITYPLSAADISPPPANVKRVRVGSITGYVDAFGGINWLIGGKFARIRGDLGVPTLAELAAGTTLRGGHPVLAHPPARFRVVASEPFRAPVVAESRYTHAVRQNAGPIDGLIFTDVLRGASFEEELYAEGSTSGGVIGGHRAVSSAVGGGNATLAWEPIPGTVVYVGYSGGLAATASTAALVDLARAGRLLDRRQWLATHPSVVNNTNVYS